MVEGCLLASSLTFIYLAYTSQVHLPRNGTAHSGLSPTLLMSSQENAQDMPTANLIEEILHLRFPLLKCVKFNTKIM